MNQSDKQKIKKLIWDLFDPNLLHSGGFFVNNAEIELYNLTGGGNYVLILDEILEVGKEALREIKKQDKSQRFTEAQSLLVWSIKTLGPAAAKTTKQNRTKIVNWLRKMLDCKLFLIELAASLALIRLQETTIKDLEPILSRNVREYLNKHPREQLLPYK